MAPEHDGNEVKPPVVPGGSAGEWTTCPHGVQVYTSGDEVIHVGNGTLCNGNDAATEQFDKIPMEQSEFGRPSRSEPFTIREPTFDPTFLFTDSNGKPLVEFRVRDGYVEAKYYPSDLDEGARAFIDYMMSIQQG